MEFYTVNQVSNILQVTPKTVRNMIARGSLPGAYKIDPDSPRSTYRIPPAALEQLILKRNQPGESL